MDVRVEAVRADAVVGRGTCSVTDETMTDEELAAFLDRAGVTTAAAAVTEMRSFEEIRADVFNDITSEARREAEIHRADMRAAYEEDLAWQARTCTWLIEVSAQAWHNARYDEMVAAMTEEEIEEYGMPEAWYPESPGDLTMTIECGAPVDSTNTRSLCEGHEHMMAMPEMEFEMMVEAR